MIEVKRFSGKLNRDDTPYLLPPEDYTDAENITHDAVEGNQDSHVTNIVANRLVVNNYFGTFYNNDNFDFLASVFNNGNGTQKVSLTFDLGSEPITAIGMQYFDGVDWITFALRPEGSTDSFFSGNIPLGTYPYRVVLFYDTIPSEVYYDLTLVDGEDICIGAYANNLRNTIIFFNWNSFGYHAIYEYNNTTRTIVPIFINLIESNFVDILGFTRTGKISSINVYNRDEGDLLIFLDSAGRPTYMDIATMKSQSLLPLTRDMIDLATCPPLIQPLCLYANDSTQVVNYLRNNFFLFQYRWLYRDGRKSTFSPISGLSLPIKFLNTAYTSVQTNNNVINITLQSGDKDVKSIEVGMMYSQKSNSFSPLLSVQVINKADLSISDNSSFNYAFYNDSTYPAVNPAEAIQLYDYVPLSAKAQELADGKNVVYGAIREGYDNDIVANVVNTITKYAITAPVSGNLTQITTFEVRLPSGFPPPTSPTLPFPRYQYNTGFAGIASVGTVITMQVRKVSDASLVLAATYTTVNGDTDEGIRDALFTSATGLNIYSYKFKTSTNGFSYQIQEGLYENESIVTIVAPTTSLSDNSTPVWLWSSQRNIGIAYFDKKGRTNGVVYNAKVSFFPYEEDVSGNIFLSNINTKIYHRPPIWAYSFQFVFTKDNTNFLFWVCAAVNTTEADYIYFDVTDFITNASKYPTTSTVLSYSFQDGDRLRMTKQLGTTAYYTDDYDAAILGLVADPTINGVTQTGKQFLKIRKVTPFSNATIAAQQYEFQIYRPTQTNANTENKVFYECGRQYNILNPGTVNRVHAGEVTDQSVNLVTPAEFNFSQGDTYFRQRIVAINDTTTVLFNVQDRNITDEYVSGVNSINGRPNQIDPNAKQAFYGALIRNSAAYVPNTNINGLNRFYGDAFLEVDYSYSDIERFSVRDRFMRVFQQYKIGSIPIYNTIGRSPTGDEITINTQTLLNPVQYYVGNWGIGTAATSLASFNFADYGCDNIKGAIWRVSNNGVEVLSIKYKMNNWSNDELPLRKNPYFIYGCFEQRQNDYVVALEATETSEAQTLTWDEEGNRFDSFVKYHPEMMCSLGILFVTFKNGQLWTHDNEPFYNNFYGTQYDSSITGVFNKDVLQKKTYISIAEVTSKVWDCPEIETTINSYGAVKQQSELFEQDFVELEGDFNASFLRDKNSQGFLINGDTLKGNWIKIKFRGKNQQPPLNNIITLSLISVNSIDSPLNKR